MATKRAVRALLAIAALAACDGGDQPSVGAPGSAMTLGRPPAAFVMCRSCHLLEPGRHAIGPNLDGVGGRPAASLPDYDYSAAMRESGLIWDRLTLDRFLADPRAVVPGTKMSFPGISDPERRRSLVDYLLGHRAPNEELPQAPKVYPPPLPDQQTEPSQGKRP